MIAHTLTPPFLRLPWNRRALSGFRLRGRTVSVDSSESAANTRGYSLTCGSQGLMASVIALSLSFFDGVRLMTSCIERVPELGLILRSFREESNLRLVNSRDAARNDDQR